MRALLSLLLAVLLAGSLAACGRKGNPEVPEDSVYPHTYPYTPLPGKPNQKAKDQ